LDLRPQNLHGGVCLARKDPARGVADIRAILIEPYAPYQFLNRLFSQAGIGTIGTGLGSLKTRPDGFSQRINIGNLHPAGMSSQHL